MLGSLVVDWAFSDLWLVGGGLLLAGLELVRPDKASVTPSENVSPQ